MALLSRVGTSPRSGPGRQQAAGQINHDHSALAGGGRRRAMICLAAAPGNGGFGA
jgi:hypothetical protein